MAELPKYEVSPQEGATLMSKTIVKWWLAAVGTMTHVMGSENAMKAYGPVMKSIGKESTEELNKKFKITSKDAIALASMVNFWEGMMGIQGRIEEATPKKVVKVITACPPF
jgi:hypothetical protein